MAGKRTRGAHGANSLPASISGATSLCPCHQRPSQMQQHCWRQSSHRIHRRRHLNPVCLDTCGAMSDVIGTITLITPQRCFKQRHQPSCSSWTARNSWAQGVSTVSKDIQCVAWHARGTSVTTNKLATVSESIRCRSLLPCAQKGGLTCGADTKQARRLTTDKPAAASNEDSSAERAVPHAAVLH